MRKRQVLLTAAAMMTVCSLASGTYLTDIRADGNSKSVQTETQKLEKLNAQMEKEIEQLDKKVSASNEKYEKYTEKQKELKEQIQKAKKELEEAKESKDKQYETMSKRIKFLYENGDTAYLEIILESESFQELIQKAEYVSKVAEYDSNMFKQLKETEEKIEKTSKQLEEDYDNVTKLAEKAKDEKEQLDKTVTAKKEKVQEYQQQLSENEDLRAVYEESEQEAASEESESTVSAAAGSTQSGESASESSTSDGTSSESTGSTGSSSGSTGGSSSTSGSTGSSTGSTGSSSSGSTSSSSSGSSSSSSGSSSSTVSSSSTLLWPVPSLHTISSGYGYRVHPVTGVYKLHGGIDIPCATGTTLVAADSGRVEVAGYSAYNGYYIKIDHGNGLETMYLHCSQLLVSAGDYVSRGQTIAKSGATGMVTGAHLHFVVKKNGSYVNPMNYL